MKGRINLPLCKRGSEGDFENPRGGPIYAKMVD